MRQADNAEANQHPERGHKGGGQDIIRTVRRHQLWVDPLQCVHRLMQAAGSMDDTNQQDDRPDQHHHSLHRIVEYAGAEAAESGIQRDGDPKDQQTGFVLDPGSGFQQARAANKLHRDGPDKGHQQADAGNPYHRAALVARLQHIVKGNSIVASRQDRELLAEDPEREPDRRYLDHR